MGRAAGEIFLDWLAPEPGWRWVDVGCGSGAFTKLIVDRCAPSEVTGIAPSPAQLSFADSRALGHVARFKQGDALALPFSDACFDAAVMALVIFFVPDPAKGVSEMARVVRRGGTVAAYVWDMTQGGHPLQLMHAEMHAMGFSPPTPPRSEITSVEALAGLWKCAMLNEVETQEITVKRTFPDFGDYWRTSTLAATVAQTIGTMTQSEIEMLKARTRARLALDAAGRVFCTARANAIRGTCS